MIEKINITADFILNKIPFQPEIALILGTGLNSVAEMMQISVVLDYADVPNMPISTAPSHQGRFVFGKLGDKKVVIMQGRLHYYEGYSMQDITFPIRVLKAIGVKKLIITNAAGSLREHLQPGDLVLIKDHLNLTGDNPLIGKNNEKLGERFPSMHEPYSKKMIEFSQKIAEKHNFKLETGVYAGLTGPSLETLAECKMLQILGADLVGMSTVPEAIVAIHSQMEVLGISVVTNLSNIFHSNPHTQEEIRANAIKARHNMEILITNLMKKI
ncbi:MAG: purine-nucleoside phosphorylase [Candidatus Cloacimonetes bacterium]|jgi:purine-nucleoside phosphorylase|nr:purine-nucleoside phosphorylase [Candidatus Cloacimonadota bacterium]MBT6993907.1 purine-nucleoside phosphorylase [Candidatus Cloacimonadota bacterium]MBT7468946.1 purine-nucleoside phosphorylase [Candidatus Cloacimonadota bacterium]